MLLEIELFKKKKEKKKTKGKKIKITLSLGYPNSYFYNRRCNMLLYLWPYLSFFYYIKLLLFVNAKIKSFIMSKNMAWTFVGENAKGAHGEIYKFHISVIFTNVFDQVQIFCFFTHCIVIKVRLETNC